MARKKSNKKKTIGEMTKTRGEWAINPITRVKESKKKYDRNSEKRRIQRGDY